MTRIMLLIFSAALFLISCETKSINSQQPENKNVNPTKENTLINQTESVEKTVYVSEIWVKEDFWEIKDFVVKKVSHKVKPKDLTEAYVTDAVIQKNGKTLLKLNGIYHGLGNTTNFAPFPLLGENRKQLIVSHTFPRGGIHYVVDFSPNPKIIFDSRDFAVGGEDLGIGDVDNDGIYEVLLSTSSDYFNFVSSEIPYIQIIFRFDKQIQKFLPVNHKLPELTLGYINGQIKRFNESREKRFSSVLEITLTYIYLGKEKEAWEFFDKNFAPQNWSYGGVENKEEAKEKIKVALDKDPIYKFIKNDLKAK